MSNKARILFPVIAALVIGGGIVLFLWWSLHFSAANWQDRLKALTQPSGRTVGGLLTATLTPIDTGDRVLLALRQGDVLALQGRYGEAEKAYQQAVDAGGGLTALKKLAQAQLQRRNIDGAKKTIDAIQGAGAKEEDILLLKVIVALRTGDTQGAASLLQGADDSPQKQYGLALIDISQGKHDDAKQSLASVQNGWEPVLRQYADVLMGAYNDYAAFPEQDALYLNTLLSRALAQVQECELSLPLLSQVISQSADYRDAWIVKGYCELTTERYQDALNSLERAYTLDPENASVQYFLGRTYAALGDHKNAQTFLTYAIRNGFQPEREARRLMIEEARKSGDAQTALSAQQALIALPDAEREDFQSYVAAALGANQNQAAYEAGVTATQKWPDDAYLLELLGHAASALGKKDEAKTAYEKALSIDPSRGGAKDGLKKL